LNPLILITNDDSVFSPGLLAVVEAVHDLGNLLIVAPHLQQTSMSCALPAGQDIGIIETHTLVTGGQSFIAYAVHGSPSQCVVYAVYELTDRKPTLCISGINYGENIGMTTAISGTVGAALEASLCGMRAMAVSLEVAAHHHHSEVYGTVDWTYARNITRQFALTLLNHPLPDQVSALNINVPASATLDTDIRATVQSQQAYFYFDRAAKRDQSQGYRLPVVRTFQIETLEPDSDIQGLIMDRVVTVTPLTGNLTAKIDQIGWFSAENRDVTLRAFLERGIK